MLTFSFGSQTDSHPLPPCGSFNQEDFEIVAERTDSKLQKLLDGSGLTSADNEFGGRSAFMYGTFTFCTRRGGDRMILREGVVGWNGGGGEGLMNRISV